MTRPHRLVGRAALWALALALAASAPAQPDNRFAPRGPESPADDPLWQPPPDAGPRRAPAPAADDARRALRGIVVLARAADFQPTGLPGRDGIWVQLAGEERGAELTALLEPFLGRRLAFDVVEEITEAVQAWYREQDRMLVDVLVPEQEVVGGVLQIVITEGRLGQVRVNGARFFPAGRLAAQITATPGQPVSVDQLDGDLRWLNRNPFRSAEATFAKGENPGETDIVLRVRDRLPWRPYAGYEDNGSRLTGRGRILAGLTWGNGPLPDHQLGYQFTGSSEWERLQAHSLSYTAPLPWRHLLAASLSYVETEAAPAPAIELLGENLQATLRYTVPLRSTGRFQQELSAGADFKSGTNDFEFVGVVVPGNSSDTDVLQFSLAYSASLADERGQWSFGGSAVYSPGNLTSRNDNEAFAGARAGAEARYGYFRAYVERLQQLPWGLTGSLRLSGQYTGEPLLSSEQLGLGGYGTVRGYDERQVNADRGLTYGAEVRSPSTQLIGRWQKKFKDDAQLVAFVEGGLAETLGLAAGVDDSADLLAAGLGVRYRWSPYAQLRMDYAWQLREAPGTGPESGRAHVSVVFSY